MYRSTQVHVYFYMCSCVHLSHLCLNSCACVVPSSRASTEALAPFLLEHGLAWRQMNDASEVLHTVFTMLSAGSADFEAWRRAIGVRMTESTRRTYSCGCCASGVQERLGHEWMVHVPLETPSPPWWARGMGNPRRRRFPLRVLRRDDCR